jgi:hypothetical protein
VRVHEPEHGERPKAVLRRELVGVDDVFPARQRRDRAHVGHESGWKQQRGLCAFELRQLRLEQLVEGMIPALLRDAAALVAPK